MLALAIIVAVAGCTQREQPAPAVADPSARRMTASGPVVGFQGEYGNHEWRGIPYAKPPVGALRWRAPQPPEAWTDTRVALDFGPPCTQYASTLGGVPGREGSVGGSEDCLTLNIYAPRVGEKAVPAGERRWPVMVWIHGGGNSIGESGFYDGGHLAAAENVVVVTINYRLGPFGWFRHAALRADSADAAEQSGNFATLDHIRALEWVRDHIAAFGGDANNVTIFGESAGGRNVYTLLLAPPAKGLFHRAIVQSGGLGLGSLAEAEHFTDAAEPGGKDSSNEVLARLLVADGTAADRGAAKARVAAMSSADIAAYLRGKSNDDIMKAYTPWPGNGMIDMPQTFTDGAVVPAGDPLQQFARPDGYNRVPVMLGTTHDESKLFMFNDPQLVRRYFWIVPRLRDERMYNLTAEYQAAMWKANGADMPAAAMAATQPGIFVYRFDWDEEPTLLGADLGVMLGAAHAFEIPFVFGHFDLGEEGNVIFTQENEPGRQALSKKMMSYWAQFARTGTPGRGSDGTLTEWTAWTARPNGAQYMVLDTDAGGGTRLSQEVVTDESVLAAVDADKRLTSARDRCAVLHDLAQWARSKRFSQADYAARKECAEYPFDKYPWS
jgi:para-nitrobenzyl esterase